MPAAGYAYAPFKDFDCTGMCPPTSDNNSKGAYLEILRSLPHPTSTKFIRKKTHAICIGS
ncbi:hypothetical protein [Nostoc sp.]|uniref:hypothetical protein n=1 Tax=Nostoc sp. TaxID=1180 RepID=UPI002FF81B2B